MQERIEVRRDKLPGTAGVGDEAIIDGAPAHDGIPVVPLDDGHPGRPGARQRFRPAGQRVIAPQQIVRFEDVPHGTYVLRVVASTGVDQTLVVVIE